MEVGGSTSNTRSFGKAVYPNRKCILCEKCTQSLPQRVYNPVAIKSYRNMPNVAYGRKVGFCNAKSSVQERNRSVTFMGRIISDGNATGAEGNDTVRYKTTIPCEQFDKSDLYAILPGPPRKLKLDRKFFKGPRTKRVVKIIWNKCFLSSSVTSDLVPEKDQGNSSQHFAENKKPQKRESNMHTKNRFAKRAPHSRRGKYSFQDRMKSVSKNVKTDRIQRIPRKVDEELEKIVATQNLLTEFRPKSIDISAIVSQSDYIRGLTLTKRNKLVHYLYDLQKKGLVYSWDLFESENRLIRECAYDALTFDASQALGEYF